MTLTHIAVFSLAALLYLLLVPARGREWALLVGSLVAVYWLQPALPIRRLDFLLPSLTIALTVLLWILIKKDSGRVTDTAPTDNYRWRRDDLITLGLVLVVVIGISLTRYLIPELRPTPSRPPSIALVLMGIALLMGLVLLLNQLSAFYKRLVIGAQLFILLLFILLKTEALTLEVSQWLRGLTEQNVAVASVSDLQWLGFSYVAFRWLHLLRDWQFGTLPALTLRQHLTYVLFFPAITAGPIDRAERFLQDSQALPSLTGLAAPRITEGVARIGIGIFKKFVVGDTLALIALNANNAEQATSTLGLWVLLYAYAFRLYFDFSGYSDIAIGIGILFGIRLPENFDRPYLKTSITNFWQSWHITLSDWVRFYVFSPLSRALLRRKPRPHPRLIVFLTQMATMLTIGLWHGVTLNFLIWGVWHGIGLFLHKLWTDRTRQWYMSLEGWRKQAWMVAGVLLTFHYVALGWVWFSLADFEIASRTFLKLFGA